LTATVGLNNADLGDEIFQILFSLLGGGSSGDDDDGISG
jgi:hypothetical protein